MYDFDASLSAYAVQFAHIVVAYEWLSYKVVFCFNNKKLLHFNYCNQE